MHSTWQNHAFDLYRCIMPFAIWHTPQFTVAMLRACACASVELLASGTKKLPEVHISGCQTDECIWMEFFRAAIDSCVLFCFQLVKISLSTVENFSFLKWLRPRAVTMWRQNIKFADQYKPRDLSGCSDASTLERQDFTPSSLMSDDWWFSLQLDYAGEDWIGKIEARLSLPEKRRHL